MEDVGAGLANAGSLATDAAPGPLPKAGTLPDCFDAVAEGTSLLPEMFDPTDWVDADAPWLDVLDVVGVSPEKSSVFIVAAPGPFPTAGTLPTCLEEIGVVAAAEPALRLGAMVEGGELEDELVGDGVVEGV